MKPAISLALLFCVASASRAQPAPTPEPRTVAQWQAAALKKYPALADPGSTFNKDFLAEVAHKKEINSAILSKPDWPMVIADRVAAADAAEKASMAENAPVPIVGKVLQKTDAGLLVKCSGLYAGGHVTGPNGVTIKGSEKAGPMGVVVLLKDHPGAADLVDEDKVATIGVPAGTFEYQAILGSRKTVRAYTVPR